eukprot:TRINITY_DN1482_c0_g1_i1.p1 TRINITY_DN1482_c0_g1~~TRINITY_DN1482_c0_g1_i1.p1  ORF type:complete len:429 (-),score=69.57 TRINITY_DN1482_c0_g1_i1:155-1441(-)
MFAAIALVLVSLALPATGQFSLPNTVQSSNPSWFTCPSLPTCNTATCPSGNVGSLGNWDVPAAVQRTGCNLGIPFAPADTTKCNLPYLNFQTTAAGCCALCTSSPICTYWQQFATVQDMKTQLMFTNLCFLYQGVNTPSCGTAGLASLLGMKYPSSVGAKCTASATGSTVAKLVDDPHFLGAQGTRFDFTGIPGGSFCLVTDQNLHVNMELHGYYDNRTKGSEPDSTGKPRTWVRKLAAMWIVDDTKHSVILEARDGKQQERGDGFLRSFLVDGETMPLPEVGETVGGQGGVALEFVGLERRGRIDIDHYLLRIIGIVVMDLRLRVAHPSVQPEDDAEAHINIGLRHLEHSSSVHGILGQTFRSDHTSRAVDFQQLVRLLHRPVDADGATGRGFLDGASEDYISSSIMATDCKFSSFQGRMLPLIPAN